MDAPNTYPVKPSQTVHQSFTTRRVYGLYCGIIRLICCIVNPVLGDYAARPNQDLRFRVPAR